MTSSNPHWPGSPETRPIEVEDLEMGRSRGGGMEEANEPPQPDRFVV